MTALSKRKTWKARVCVCGGKVHCRTQIDYAYCGTLKCYIAVLASMGLTRKRKRKEKK